MAEYPIMFVKLTPKDDGVPTLINLGLILGLRELPEGGVCLLTHNGALHVQEPIEVLLALPFVESWQMPEKPPEGAEPPAERSEEMLVEDPPKTE